MITDFSNLTLPEIRKKLLETKELLRYLDEKYNLDQHCKGHASYWDGSDLLAQAAAYVDELILFDEIMFSDDPEHLKLDDPETVLPYPVFTSCRSPDDCFNPLLVGSSL